MMPITLEGSGDENFRLPGVAGEFSDDLLHDDLLVKMQELRIHAEDTAALSLANDSRSHLFRTDVGTAAASLSNDWRPDPFRPGFGENLQSSHFGRASQAAQSTQTPERKCAALPATEPTPRVPGHLSYLAQNSSGSKALADEQSPERVRNCAASPALRAAPRVLSAHPPTRERERISYPVLAATPKLPGHLSTTTDRKPDHKSPVGSESPHFLPIRLLPPHTSSPPLQSQQPPGRDPAADFEIRNDGGKKSHIRSIIQAISSKPLEDTKLDVIAEMIVQSQTSREVEGIISALDQSFPVVSVLGRLRRILNIEDLEHTSTPDPPGDCADRYQGVPNRQKADHRHFSDASHLEARSTAHSPSVVEAQDHSEDPDRAPLNMSLHSKPSREESTIHDDDDDDYSGEDDDDGGLSYVEEPSVNGSVQDRRELLGPVGGRSDPAEVGVPVKKILYVSWGTSQVRNAHFRGPMYWTMSSSDAPLDFQDLYLYDERTAPGHVHIHKNTSNLDNPYSAFLLETQPTINDRDSWTWQDISSRYNHISIVDEPFVLHPLHPTNALKIDETWAPRYVLAASLKQQIFKQARLTRNPGERKSERNL